MHQSLRTSFSSSSSRSISHIEKSAEAEQMGMTCESLRDLSGRKANQGVGDRLMNR
jgi:hypothetical protein